MTAEALAVSRDQSRSRRKRVVRARTISVKKLSKRERLLGRLLYPETDFWRPRVRAECELVERPCPFVACRHHLYLDVDPRTGSIKLNFPDLEVEEMGESCALDVADRGGVTLESLGEILNVTRERIRQIEVSGLRAVAPHLARFVDTINGEEPVMASRSPWCRDDDHDDGDEADDDDDDEEEMI